MVSWLKCVCVFLNIACCYALLCEYTGLLPDSPCCAGHHLDWITDDHKGTFEVLIANTSVLSPAFTERLPSAHKFTPMSSERLILA